MLFKIGFHLHFSVREVKSREIISNLPNEAFKYTKNNLKMNGLRL